LSTVVAATAFVDTQIVSIYGRTFRVLMQTLLRNQVLVEVG